MDSWEVVDEGGEREKRGVGIRRKVIVFMSGVTNKLTSFVTMEVKGLWFLNTNQGAISISRFLRRIFVIIIRTE